MRPLLIYLAALAVMFGLPVSGIPDVRKAPPRYSLTDLGREDGVTHGVALNALGQVALNHKSSGQQTWRPFFWDPEGGHVSIGVSTLYDAWAGAINDHGVIAGTVNSPSGYIYTHPFVWRAGVTTILDPTGDDSDSAGDDINNRGQVAGETGPPWPYVLDPERGSSYLQGRGVFFRAHVGAINDRGQVAGLGLTYLHRGPTGHALFWPDLTAQPIQITGAGNWEWSTVSDLNNAGQIVGSLALPRSRGRWRRQAFFWDRRRGLRRLGTLYHGQSYATALNDAGQVVGTVRMDETSATAFLYTGGRMYELNHLIPSQSGWTLIDAADINDSGQIVGTGVYQGQTRAVLLIPTTFE